MTLDHGQKPQLTHSELARSMENFFQLSSELALSEAENCALLDLSADAIVAVRDGTTHLPPRDQSKLQRRLDYAIPILQRMLVSLAS